MKKLLLLICILFLVGCENEPIRIGVVGSMTGTASDLSISGRRGIELAVEEINESGGIDNREIVLVVKDDQNDPLRSKMIVEEFADEGIEIVIGHFTSGMLLSAYEAINEHGILYLGPTISADSLTGLDDYFIRFIASTKEQAVILAETAKKNNHKNFAVIYDEKNIGFNEMLYNNFQSEIEAFDGSVIKSLSFKEINDETLDSIETGVEGVDAIFIIAGATDFSYIAQHINANNQYPLYGPLWAHTNDLLRLSGNSIEGAYIISGIDYENTTMMFDEFSLKYRAAYGQNVTFSSMYAYETMKALAEAIEITGTTNSLSVKNQLTEIATFQGIASEFYLDTYGDNTRKYIIDQVIKGRYVRFND